MIDAAEGVMPQTRFVLTKALQCGLKPIILVNKIDRSDARPFEVLDEAFELLMELEGGHHLQGFPFIFTTAREGYATESPAHRGDSMRPLLDMVLREIPGPEVEPDAPLQMLVTTLDWSEYVGRIAIGRIQAGTIRQGQTVALLQADDKTTTAKIAALYVFENLGRLQVDQATAGDVVAIVGLGQIRNRRHDLRPGPSAAHAAIVRRRADAGDGFFDQQLAVCRPRRKIRHHAAAPRAAVPRIGA